METDELAPQAAEKKQKPIWREISDTILVALSLALLTRAAVAEPRYIPSESMLPTLQIEDRLIVEKLSGYMNAPKRGDILVFFPKGGPEDDPPTVLENTLKWVGLSTDTAYIKRVIGLPGEVIEIKDGRVFINGKALNESHYIKEPPLYSIPAQTIPPGHLFMLGDNRNDSYDSHIWGPLPMNKVIGQARFLFWPLDRWGSL